MNGELHPALDAHRIAPRLWVGSYPRPQRILPFTMWVQCAAEFGRPDPSDYGSSLAGDGLRIVWCPLHDDGRKFEGRHFNRAIKAMHQVVAHHRQGGRVLVTCAQGRNRSAFVAALALTQLAPMTADQAIAHVRAHRPHRGGVLVNEQFNAALRSTDRWARSGVTP